jgi:hypothetical protein
MLFAYREQLSPEAFPCFLVETPRYVVKQGGADQEIAQ